MEAIKNLNEPTGSHRTTIANYIEVCILLLFLYLLRTRVILCFYVHYTKTITFYFECNVKRYVHFLFVFGQPKILHTRQIVRCRFNVSSV